MSLHLEYGYMDMLVRYRCLLIYDCSRVIAWICDGLMVSVNLRIFSSPARHCMLQHSPILNYVVNVLLIRNCETMHI